MNFLQLSETKQTTIINAALKHFALKGYKKASAMDIARDAGISKAMIFHYFGNKKAMYVYLIHFANDTLNTYVDAHVDDTIADVFDMVSRSTIGKIEACGVYPYILTFIASVFKETDKDVLGDVQAYTEKTIANVQGLVQQHLDYSKFREDIPVETAMKIMSLTSEGILSRFSNDHEVIASEQLAEYETCMLALKNIFYKKEDL